jgi:hypothetical protein
MPVRAHACVGAEKYGRYERLVEEEKADIARRMLIDIMRLTDVLHARPILDLIYQRALEWCWKCPPRDRRAAEFGMLPHRNSESIRGHPA